MTKYIYRTKMRTSSIHLRYRECAANLIIDPQRIGLSISAQGPVSALVGNTGTNAGVMDS
jgi:hypothetical protein